jgi:hypothetical protein
MAGWVTESSGLIVCEEADSRRENFLATAFEAHVDLRCNWEDRFKVMWDIYMNNVSYPDVPNCLVASYGCRPAAGQKPKPLLDTFPNVMQYSEAIISVKYSTSEADADFLYLETLEPLIQGMRMSRENFQWDLTGSSSKEVKQGEAPDRHIHQWAYTVHWIQQEEIPSQFFDLPGYVNESDYTIERWGIECPPETMLYTAGPSGRSVWYDPDDSESPPKPGWDYTAKFLINQFKWNTFYNASVPLASGDEDDARWIRMKQKINDNTFDDFEPYPLTDDFVPSLLPTPSGP